MKKRKKSKVLTPTIVIGILVVLLPLFTLMTLDRMKKQKDHLLERVLERGGSLLRTFEAGTRAGMLTMGWGAQRIQAMLTETAAQPDISYIMITDSTGRILAHSQEGRAGELYGAMPDLGPVKEDMTRVFSRIRSEGKEAVFEVYKRFVPLKVGFRGRHMHGMQAWGNPPPEVEGGPPDGDPGAACPGDGMGPGDGIGPGGGMASGAPHGMGRQARRQPDFSRMEEHYIFVGLSMARMTELEGRMAKAAIGRGILFFVLGCAGVISLFAFQAYRSARADLERVQAFSDTVVQNMPSGLVTLDTGYGVSSANRAARRILGEIPPTAYPQMIRMAREVGETGGKPVSKEVTLTPETGPELHLDMTASAILGDDREIQGFLFLFRDLTRLQELLREVETNRRLAAIGKLAGGVAHEIRNPLSSIKGFATYLAKRVQNNPEDAETADIMVQEVERINRSITQLLEFANPMAVEKRRVEIEPLISHSLKLVSRDLEKGKIASRADIRTSCAWMVTDPDRLNQVLLNLYMNAVSSMDRAMAGPVPGPVAGGTDGGGTLEVTVDDLPGKESPSGGIRIRVRDTGCGIAPDHLDKIFDPYFTTRAKGTGLGLSIVHRIVENLKGEIGVESLQGRGTCFTLSLPGAAVDQPLNQNLDQTLAQTGDGPETGNA